MHISAPTCLHTGRVRRRRAPREITSLDPCDGGDATGGGRVKRYRTGMAGKLIKHCLNTVWGVLLCINLVMKKKEQGEVSVRVVLVSTKSILIGEGVGKRSSPSSTRLLRYDYCENFNKARLK